MTNQRLGLVIGLVGSGVAIFLLGQSANQGNAVKIGFTLALVTFVINGHRLWMSTRGRLPVVTGPMPKGEILRKVVAAVLGFAAVVLAYRFLK
jgi:hypothetical protein